MLHDKLDIYPTEGENWESPEVQRLIARRAKFLADHPQLRSTQKEIDKLMSTTLDPVVRLEILFMLISGKLTEMRKVFEEVMRLAQGSLPK